MNNGQVRELERNYPTNYISQGDGPPIVMVHGIAASLNDWVALAPRFSAAGYSAHALDLLGHGDSHKPPSAQQYHIRNLLAHLEEWLLALDLSNRLVLVAHSLGAYLSLAYAQRHAERVHALILVNPFYSLDQLSPVVRFLNRRPELGVKALRLAPQGLIHTLLSLDPEANRNFSPEVRRQIALDYKRASPNIMRVLHTLQDVPLDLAHLSTPTLILWGEHDHTLSPHSFTRLAHLLPSAVARQIPACGHQPHLAFPGLVKGMALNFLQSVDASH